MASAFVERENEYFSIPYRSRSVLDSDLGNNKMAEGMDVDPAPAVRDKKRFEVKKVSQEFL